MSEVEKFKQYLIDNGFTISKTNVVDMLIADLSLVPYHRASETGQHTLIDSIHIADFGGSDVKPGDLGCVTIGYGGKIRNKYMRQSIRGEILKKAFCPKTAAEAIKVFEQWKTQTHKTIKSWKVIL